MLRICLSVLVRVNLREKLARVKVFIDYCLTNKQPKHFGEKVNNSKQ